MYKKLLILVLLIVSCKAKTIAQIDSCIYPVKKHEIYSKHLNEDRAFWVSLPLRYSPEESYPVLYVFDAEWRFGMLSHIVYDMGGNQKIPRHIVVGIPHIDWKEKRGIDFTFSQSRMEYDGEAVDSTLYNASNSGGGENFYQIYDPSIWFSAGEAIKEIKENLSKEKALNVFISYQPIPEYHSNKIEELIETLSTYERIDLGYKRYADETHNSLFLPSFLEGMRHLYQDWKE